MEVQPTFVEEIDFCELQFLETVGRGAFGVVSRARWRGMDVAVKAIETEAERKAFITELKQLSRVSHPNIIKLYGACTNSPVCLVMEYAEGGSLYNVLHGDNLENLPSYTGAHAMSWALQCAKGVSYLHGMKPKPLIHRDLKPPNLLLISGGTVLKICDFGTACDAHTHMTNNKGSAAWMAPEVFEGNNYSEKCDVFSWGIILWEVLTRKKPFDEIGGPAFRIMWAVHNGTRPPLIVNCPKPLEVLMTRCWSANPCERPSMSEVERVMTYLFKYFEGADVPLRYPIHDDRGIGDMPLTNLTQGGRSGQGHTIQETVRHAFTHLGEPVPIPITPQKPKPVVVQVHDDQRRTSAPASLAASRESLLDGTKGSRSSTPSYDVTKRFSADLSKLEEMDYMKNSAAAEQTANKKSVLGHRRSGSYGTTSNLLGPNWQPSPARGHRRTGSHGNSPLMSSEEGTELHHSVTAPEALYLQDTSGSKDKILAHSQSWAPSNRKAPPASTTLPNVVNNDPAWNMQIMAMDHQLQPLPPCPTNSLSLEIYNQHRESAMEYIRVQTEMYLLKQREQELQKELALEEPEESPPRLIEEYQQLMGENESLVMLLNNLKKQVEQIKQQNSSRGSGGPAGGPGGGPGQ